MPRKNLHELNPYKKIKGKFVIYNLPVNTLNQLKLLYNDRKFRWKFPKLLFTKNGVIYEYIDDGFTTSLKTFFFIIRNIISGQCFLDDLPRNIKGKLIDFGDIVVVPRKMYLLHLLEFKFLKKILYKIFRQQYFKIYTFKKQILNYHPLVLKSSTGVEILDEDFETDTKYDFLLKTYIKKGKYLDILNEYISCN